MAFLDLFLVASMPVLKVLLITALGSYLALDSIGVLGEDVRKQLNRIVFLVFSPALVGSNLAKTITSESIASLWFMPLNILCTFIVGSALGWILIKITRTPQHLKGLILGCCAAGNLGNLPIIIIPAVCREKGSPFGDPDVCYTYGMAYASLSMALGAVYTWSYVYNIVRISSSKINKVTANYSAGNMKSNGGASKLLEGHISEALLPSNECSESEDHAYQLMLPCIKSDGQVKVPIPDMIKQYLTTFASKINLKAIFAPSTIAAITGFIIGVVPQIRNLMIGRSAPLRVVEDSVYLLGEAAIPAMTLIVGGNLLRGLKGGIQVSVIVGIIAVRFIFLPLLGIVIVKGALHFGILNSDPLYLFVLLLQYAVPPAMNMGTITQLFGAGESECSVIMLWTYALASVSLTFWSTLFMWLVT